MIKSVFSASLLQSSVSHDSEIILICKFSVQETCLIIISLSILGRGKIVAHMMEVFRWKTGISAEGLSTRLLLHNTLQKWTEILEKHQLAKYDDLLFLFFSVTIFLSMPQFLPFSLRSHRSAHDRALRGLFFWSGTDTLRLVSLKEFCSSQTDWLIFIPPPLPRPIWSSDVHRCASGTRLRPLKT